MASPYDDLFDEADALDEGGTTTATADQGEAFDSTALGSSGLQPPEIDEGRSPYQDLFDEADKIAETEQKPQQDQALSTPYTDQALTATQRLARVAKGYPDAKTVRMVQAQPTAPPKDWTTGVGHIEGLADTTPGGRADQVPGQQEGEPGWENAFPQELTPILTDLWKGGVREATKGALAVGPLGAGALVPGPVGKVSRGLIQGGAELSAGLFGEPENLALIAATEGLGLLPAAGGTVASKAVSAYFGYEMYKQLPELYKQFKEAPDLQTKTAIATQAIGTLIMGTQASKHAATPGMPGGVARDLRKYQKGQPQPPEREMEGIPGGAPPASKEVPGAPAVAGPRFRSTVQPGGGEKGAEQPGNAQVERTSAALGGKEGTGGAVTTTSGSDNVVRTTQREAAGGAVSQVEKGDTITYGKGKGTAWKVEDVGKFNTILVDPENPGRRTHVPNHSIERQVASGNIVIEKPKGAAAIEAAPAAEAPVLQLKAPRGKGAAAVEAPGEPIAMPGPKKPLLPMGPKEEPGRPRIEPKKPAPAEPEPVVEEEPKTVTEKESEVATVANKYVRQGVPHNHAVVMALHELGHEGVDRDKVRGEMERQKLPVEGETDKPFLTQDEADVKYGVRETTDLAKPRTVKDEYKLRKLTPAIKLEDGRTVGALKNEHLHAQIAERIGVVRYEKGWTEPKEVPKPEVPKVEAPKAEAPKPKPKPKKEKPKAKAEPVKVRSKTGIEPNEHGVFDREDADFTVSYSGKRDKHGRGKAEATVRVLQLEDGTWINSMASHHNQGTHAGVSYGLGVHGARFETKQEAWRDGFEQIKEHNQDMLDPRRTEVTKAQAVEAKKVIEWVDKELAKLEKAKPKLKAEPEAPIVSLNKVAQDLYKKDYDDLTPKEQQRVRNSPEYFHGQEYAAKNEISMERYGKEYGTFGPYSLEKRTVDAIHEGRPEPKIALGHPELFELAAAINRKFPNRNKGEIKALHEEFRRQWEESGKRPAFMEEHDFKIDDLVNFKVGGKEYGETGVIDKVLEDGRLKVQPIGGGKSFYINPSDVIAKAPKAPKTVKMPKAKPKVEAPKVEAPKERRKSYEIDDDIVRTRNEMLNAPQSERGPLRAKLKALEQELADALNPDLQPKVRPMFRIYADIDQAKMELKAAARKDKGPIRERIKALEAELDQTLPPRMHSIDPETGRYYHYSDDLRESVTPSEGTEAFKDARGIFANHGYPIEAVDYPFVPESGADPRKGELGPIDKAYQLAEVNKTPIGWFRGPTNLGAFYWKGELFLNIDAVMDARDPTHITAGHETSHWIEREHPELYQALFDEIQSASGTKGYQDYLAALKARAKGVYNDEQIKHEVVAEFVSDVLKDPSRFAEAIGKNPTLMQKVMRAIRDWLDITLRKLGIKMGEREGYGDIRGVVTDLRKARGMVMDMLREAREKVNAPLPSETEAFPSMQARGEIRKTQPREKDQKLLDKVGGKNMPENRHSTRHPSAEGAPDSKASQLDVSMDGIYGDPKNTRKMANKVRLAGLPRELRVKDHKGLVQNAVKFFKENKLLDWKYLQTLPKRIREGAPNQFIGYNAHAVRLADHYDTTLKRVNGMETVLSSEKPPDMSFSMTQRLLKAYRDRGDKVWDKDFTRTAMKYETPIRSSMLNALRGKRYDELLNIHEKAMWLRTYDTLFHEPWHRAVTPEGQLGDYVRNNDGTRTRISWTYPDVIGRAILIMEGHVEPVDMINGHKQGMYDNVKNAPIENNSDYVSDVHDINSSYHSSFPADSKRGRRAYGQGYLDRMTGDQGTYALHAEAGNQGAREVGVLPSMFQGGTWTVQQMLRSPRRGLRSHTTDGKAVIDAIHRTWRESEHGNITRQEARAKVDKLVEEYHASHGGVRYPDWVRPFNESHQIDPKELNTIDESYRKPAPGEGAAGKPSELPEIRGISEEPKPGDTERGSAGSAGLPPLSVTGPIGRKPDPKQVYDQWKEEAAKKKLDVNDIDAFQKWLATPQSTYVPERGSRGKMSKYNPFAILKRVYEAAQRAGEAGFKRGTKEEREVGDYELAYQAARNKEQIAAERKSGLEALGYLKNEFQTADKWMAGDQEKVREQMVEFVNTVIPKGERGEFINRITKAMKRPPLQAGEKVSDPGIMYKHAWEVMRDIEKRAHEIYKRDMISDIKDTLKKSLDAPGIDVAYRRRLKQILETVSLTKPTKATLRKLQKMKDFIDREEAAGRQHGIPKEHLAELSKLVRLPLRDMPVNALEALQKHVDATVQLGRFKARLLKERWEKRKEGMLKDLESEDSLPLEEREVYTPLPTEKLTFAQKFWNAVNKTASRRVIGEQALAPMDEIYDHMDGAKGTYNGWASRNVKGELDLAHNEAESEFRPIQEENNRIVKQYGLAKADMEAVQMKAIMNMIGRQRLEAMGPKSGPDVARYKAILDRIEANKLTPGQQIYHNFIRKFYDAMGPRVSEVAHALYQFDMIPVENYVPLERDWASTLKGAEPKPMGDVTEGDVPFNETANMDQLQRDVNPLKVSRTEQGFLIERLPGAKTPVKLNAEEVFLRHIRDALHFVHSQPVLKMLGEVARDDRFKAKYGKIAQNITLDHLDTIANRGYVSDRMRWRGLDWIRNSTSKAAVGFRLASNIVHLSQIPLAWAHAGGPHWWLYGLHKALSKEGQMFLHRNAAETYTRGGGEPAQVEAERLSGKIGRAGFWIARNIDMINAQATFLGRYAKEMHDRGVSIDNLLSKPVPKDVQSLALRRMHRSVASPLAKDVPQILSRGKGFKGNVSVGRAVFQFKNIFLDNWSSLRHDVLRVGVKEGQDILNLMRSGQRGAGIRKLGDMAGHRAAIAFALMAGITIETAIKHYIGRGLSAGAAAVTGAQPPPDKNEQHNFWTELEHHALNRIPFVGQLSTVAMYGGTGVPTIDALVEPFKEFYQIGFKVKKPETRAKHLVRGASAAATIAGIPGSTQVLQLAEPWLSQQLSGIFPEYQKPINMGRKQHGFRPSGPGATGGFKPTGPKSGGFKPAGTKGGFKATGY